MSTTPAEAADVSVIVQEVRYQEIYVKTKHSWCQVQWQENGRVVILSDYGDWSYWWGHRGSASTAAFLSQLDCDYMCNKLLGTSSQELDPDRTHRAMQDAVLRARRELVFTKEEAREEWEGLQDFEGDQRSFETWAADSRLDDAYEFARHKLNSTWQHFWGRLWLPHVRPALQAFAEKEKAQGTQPSV